MEAWRIVASASLVAVWLLSEASSLEGLDLPAILQKGMFLFTTAFSGRVPKIAWADFLRHTFVSRVCTRPLEWKRKLQLVLLI